MNLSRTQIASIKRLEKNMAPNVTKIAKIKANMVTYIAAKNAEIKELEDELIGYQQLIENIKAKATPYTTEEVEAEDEAPQTAENPFIDGGEAEVDPMFAGLEDEEPTSTILG